MICIYCLMSKLITNSLFLALFLGFFKSVIQLLQILFLFGIFYFYLVCFYLFIFLLVYILPCFILHILILFSLAFLILLEILIMDDKFSICILMVLLFFSLYTYASWFVFQFLSIHQNECFIYWCYYIFVLIWYCFFRICFTSRSNEFFSTVITNFYYCCSFYR